MEMSGRSLAKLTRLLCQCKWPSFFELELGMGLKYKPPRNRAVVPLHWALIGVIGRSGHTDRTLDPASGRPMSATCHTAFNRSRLISTVILLTGHCAQTDWTLCHQCPVVSSKVPNTNFHYRTRPVMPDRTHPAYRPSTSPLCASHQRTSALTGRTLPASSRRATQRPVILTDASVFAVTPDRTRRYNRG